MEILSWILAILGGICGILGIAEGLIEPRRYIGTLGTTPGWWLLLAIAFLAATIATNQFRKS